VPLGSLPGAVITNNATSQTVNGTVTATTFVGAFTGNGANCTNLPLILVTTNAGASYNTTNGTTGYVTFIVNTNGQAGGGGSSTPTAAIATAGNSSAAVQGPTGNILYAPSGATASPQGNPGVVGDVLPAGTYYLLVSYNSGSTAIPASTNIIFNIGQGATSTYGGLGLAVTNSGPFSTFQMKIATSYPQTFTIAAATNIIWQITNTSGFALPAPQGYSYTLIRTNQ